MDLRSGARKEAISWKINPKS